MSAYPGMPVESSRVLKIAWLLQRITWVPFPDRAEIKHERHDRFSTCAVMRSPGLPKFGERLCVASLKRDHLRGFEKKPALAPFDCIADFF